jgi:hypothetical protein
MKRRVLTQALLMGLVARGVPAFAANPLPALQETSGLLDKVKSGALPPIDKRLPKQPRVIESFSGADGSRPHGGQLNMLVASARDTRLMTIYSYTRLIVYDDKFKLNPDILESYEVKDEPRVHVQAARWPQMVGRPSLHDRGFPILLGGRRQQQGPLAGTDRIRRASGRRQAAQGGDHRSS